VSGMDSLLQRLEEREAAARDQVERLRAQITSLSAQLAAEEDTLSRLAVTRQTILTVLGGDDTVDAGVATPPVAAHDAIPEASQRVLDVFAAAGQPLRAKDVCQAVGAGTDARQVERMRTRLKRLVGRGVLAEPQPGLFVIPGTAGPAGPATTAAQRKEDQ
jgi:hypothetical protein